ncbi:MAG: hypothetical protein SGI88_02665 [Candidatus Hydrogenedentes bacterium]|nr:hypothetical protein [Candidatus Hydrogenedentota bacterium]
MLQSLRTHVLMPTPNDPKLPLRLAFSHREKADAAIRQCDRAFTQKSIDQQNHTAQRAAFVHERRVAQRTIERLTGIERARVEVLEAQRRAVLEEQVHLPERVAAHKLAAADANDANRRLTQRLAELEIQLATGKALAGARTAEELGGFIDLPITGYPPAESGAMDVTLRRREPNHARDWYAALAFAIFAGAAVFLPWMSKDGVTTSLATGGNELSRLATAADLPGSLARYAWIILAFLPFVGVIAAAGRRVTAVGWTFLLLGLIMLAAVTFPGLMLGARSAGPANVLQLMESFRVGAVIYSACALGFIVLGAYRVSPPGDSLKHAISVSLALLAAVGGVGLLAALALMGVQSMPEVSFTATLDEATRDRIAFTIHNDGRDSIACFFPMPSNGLGASPAGRLRTFGLRLSIQETTASEFRESPPAPFVWRLAQGPSPQDEAVTIAPGTDLTGYLDVRELAVLGVEAGAARIELVRSDGSPIEHVDIPLSETYLSTPGAVRDPIMVPAPPPRPSVSAPGQAQPRQETVIPETPAAPAIHVEYTGSIGGKAVIRVYSADGVVIDEHVVGPGDVVADGWQVVSVDRQPAAVQLKRETNTAIVPRGQRVELR